MSLPSLPLIRLRSALALVAVCAALLLVPASAEAGRVRYTVAPGDTLLGIALDYGVSVSDIRRWNSLDGDSIFVGQELTIRTSSGSSDRVREQYSVRSGDTGLAIARRLGVSWDELQRWNSRVDFDRLRVGQTLHYYVDGGGDEVSRGAPNRGRLRNGTLLESGHGFRVRSSTRAWGTDLTVSALRTGMARVRARHVNAPDLVVHDLSQERGGRLPPHRSHQNGRDADVSYYRFDCDAECGWQAVSGEELDAATQWYLFRWWIDQGLVEYIFVDRPLEDALRAYAEGRGATDAELMEWFGEDSSDGIIRYSPGHDDHFHVRFVAPRD